MNLSAADYSNPGPDGPFLIFADKDDMPGKVHVVFVRFERRVFDASDFHPKPVEFERLDHANPNVQRLAHALEAEA